MSFIIWNFIVDFALVLTMEDFFSTFLKKIRNRFKYIGAWLFCFAFHFVIRSEIDSYVANIVENIIVLSIVCEVAYRASIKVRTMLIILALSLGIAAEEIVIIFVDIMDGDVTGNIRLYSLIAKLVFWICVRILGVLYKGKLDTIKDSKYGFMVVATTSCNIVLIAMIFGIANRNTDDLIKSWLLIFTFLFLLFDIVIFKLYVMNQEGKLLERERQEYALQVQMYDRQVNERKAMMGDVRRVKHDIKNSMIYLQRLMKSNPEKAAEYLNNYMEINIESIQEFSNSGNLPIDSLMNYKNMIANEKNIHINLEIQIPEEIPYKASDICVILGNLLDNSIEATEKNYENREIDVRIGYKKGKLKICVKNPLIDKVEKNREGEFISNKKDKKNHGIGLSSIKRIVESYDGFIEIKTENKKFEVNILI